MARPNPTDAEILAVRKDLLDYLADDEDLQSVATDALAKVKIDLDDMRGVLWSQVWDADNTQYFVGSDSVTRNDDKIPLLISLYAVYLVFRDYAIRMGADDQWFQVAGEYLDEYNMRLKSAKLDVDSDKDGTISEDEDAQDGQTFMGR